MIDGIWRLSSAKLGAGSSPPEKSSPPTAQQIYLLREVTHQGLLKKIHFLLQPREPARSLSLADELREELKHSIKLSAETKSCSPAFLFFLFFFLALKKMPHFHFSEAGEAGNNTKALYKARLLSSVASVLKYL